MKLAEDPGLLPEQFDRQLGVTPRNGRNCMLRRHRRGDRAERPKLSFLRPTTGVPDIVTGQADVLPAERGQVREQIPAEGRFALTYSQAIREVPTIPIFGASPLLHPDSCACGLPYHEYAPRP